MWPISLVSVLTTHRIESLRGRSFCPRRANVDLQRAQERGEVLQRRRPDARTRPARPRRCFDAAQVGGLQQRPQLLGRHLQLAKACVLLARFPSSSLLLKPPPALGLLQIFPRVEDKSCDSTVRPISLNSYPDPSPTIGAFADTGTHTRRRAKKSREKKETTTHDDPLADLTSRERH